MAKAGKKNTRSGRSSKDDDAAWHANQVRWALEWANANRRRENALAEDPFQWARDATLAGAIRDALMPPAPAPSRARKAPQADRALRVIQEHYPNGVPDEVSTKTVRRVVVSKLADESKRLGLADPSWESVHRALGRK